MHEREIEKLQVEKENIERRALRIADKKAAENEERLSIQTIVKD